jgi:periplasmic protein TonB
MFDNLIESRAAKQKRGLGTAISFVVHAVLITLAVVGTLHASQTLDKPKAEKVDFVKVKKDAPKPKDEPKPPPPDVVVKAPPPKGLQVLTAPIKIPDVLPDIDLSKHVTNAADFSGVGVAGGTAQGVVGGTPQSVNSDQPLYSFQVEKQVALVPGQPSPPYPDVLRQSGFEGEVMAQFVVDSSGHADMSTFKELKSSHKLFTDAVKQQLPHYKFFPAENGGRKVAQLVQMPFDFTIHH